MSSAKRHQVLGQQMQERRFANINNEATSPPDTLLQNSPPRLGTTGMLPRLKIEQTTNTSAGGESSSFQVNSERMQIADFVTENYGEEDSEVG